MSKLEERIIISNQTEGIGLNQFEYQTDKDHYAWHYSGNGKAVRSTCFHWSDMPESRARLRFEGIKVRLYGRRGPEMGQASFCLDGLPETVCDCCTSQTEEDSLLFQSPDLAPGFHDLVIRVRRGLPKAKPVSLSYAEVFTEAAESIATSDASDCSHFIMEKAAIHKRSFALEISANGPGSEMAQLSFSPEWELLTQHENLYLAGAHACRKSDAAASVIFSGRQIEIYGMTGPEGGEVTVSADGYPAVTADCYSPETIYSALLYRSPLLPEGGHTLELRVTGRHNQKSSGSLVLIDRVSILTRVSPVISASIMPGKRFQTIENFGVSSGWTIDPICSLWSEEKKNELADLLYSQDKGIGLSCFRFDLGAGSHTSDKDRINGDSWWRATDCFQASENAPFSWDNQLGQQWMMRAAKQRGVPQYVAYVHSPPFWMTKNGHTQCDADTGSTNLLPGKERDFAKYLTGILRQFRQAGIPFDYISPVNECGWAWEFPGVREEGCRMSTNDMQRIFIALFQELKACGLPEKILGPEAETVDALTAQMDFFMGNPELRKSLGNRVSAHSYFTDLFETTGIPSRQKLAHKLAEYEPLQYWQTEYCFMGTGRGETRDYGMAPALWLAKTVYYDLVLLNASAWQWWLSISPGDFVWKDGLIYTDWRKKGDEENILPSKMLWVLGNFSRFIRPKAVRLALTGPESEGELLAAAFQNTDNSIVSVWINCSSCERLVRLDPSHQPSRRTLPYLTDSLPGNDLALREDLLSSDQLLRLPERSVVTAVTTA